MAGVTENVAVELKRFRVVIDDQYPRQFPRG